MKTTDKNKMERLQYFNDRIQDLLNPKKEIEFSNYVSIGGLLELSRQYASMPDSVRELSSTGLKDSVIGLLEKHGTLLLYKDKLPIKELKDALSTMFLISKLKNEKYIPKLFETLSNSNTYKGILRSIRYVINNGIEGCPRQDIFNLVDDLIYLLMEYLEYVGHTLSELYRFCVQQNPLNHLEYSFEIIISHLRKLDTIKQRENHNVDCILTIRSPKEHERLVTTFSDRILDILHKEGRINNKSQTKSARDGELVTINKTFSIYKLDDKYIDRVCKSMYIKFAALLERTRYSNIDVIIEVKINEKLIIVDKPRKHKKQDNMKIKHFNNFWASTSYLDLDKYVYDEMFRINEWIISINNTQEKLLSYNALWSILEFMLIDSMQENKIQAICSRFTPYMGLFYFRKVIKTFFKKVVLSYTNDQKEGEHEIVEHIQKKLNEINVKNDNIADAFCIFLSNKKLKNKWWEGLHFNNTSNTYIDILTERIHLQLTEPNVPLDRFESILGNDLRQMYRLRNMLTHSGTIDSTILDNTFDRLKYYVETLINAVSYSWINPSVLPSNIFELNDYKRVDWQTYKENAKTLKKQILKDENLILSLVNYEGLTQTPPNRFSFLND
ncbi:hypothetical protein SFC34_28335 [Priestia aryabhattai]|uniref:hypothetical protein n=1 Tax=Priestia aryabhattai TaxID=412384 RepID=UPI003982BC7E